MILADTSVWIDHLRNPETELIQHLSANNVLTHPIVIGELACGNLPDRERFLREMDLLPAVASGTHVEVGEFIESERLMGRGIGFMDAHLLYSALNKGQATQPSRSRLVYFAR